MVTNHFWFMRPYPKIMRKLHLCTGCDKKASCEWEFLKTLPRSKVIARPKALHWQRDSHHLTADVHCVCGWSTAWHRGWVVSICVCFCYCDKGRPVSILTERTGTGARNTRVSMSCVREQRTLKPITQTMLTMA